MSEMAAAEGSSACMLHREEMASPSALEGFWQAAAQAQALAFDGISCTI
jgi:hypothetical protein